MLITTTQDLIQRYITQFDMARFLNDDLLANLRVFRFPAYTHIYMEQDEQHYFYFLVEGQVQCSHYHANGKLAVIALSTPFAAIGDLEILSDERLNSNVIATQQTTMLGLSRPIIHRYGADDPRFLRFLIEQLRDKLYKSDSLKMHHTLPLVNRLAVYILAQPLLADGLIELPNKEWLASLLGITPRHLNRVLKELVESAIISPGYPCLRILDKPALQALTT